MRYLPHTEQDVAAMLSALGLDNMEQLFADIPTECRLDEELALPAALTEWELTRRLQDLADATGGAKGERVFLGAGSYDHAIPAVIPYLLSRSEFLTAYTPYQPEVSQGTLQAIFEYQTLIARLLGMPVANASVWDGASALAEAVLMALRVSRRERVAVSRAVHPAYRQVLATYLEPAGIAVVELPYGADGRTELAALEGHDDLAAVVVQSPNFFGCVENLDAAAQAARAGGAPLIATFSEALAYGLLRSPGACGAEIACGEGQSLGLPQSYGGPYLGVLAAAERFTRNLPGRLIGKTLDRDGREGFVITLATREQHIRREKATSNICSNQNLCAVAAAIYLACLGRGGLRPLARLNYDKAEYLKRGLRERGLRLPFTAPTFNEFVVELPAGAHQRLLEQGVVAGLPLDETFPELAGCTLLCVTEQRSVEDLDTLLEGISG